MKKLIPLWLPSLVLAGCTLAFAQGSTQSQSTQKPAASTPSTASRDKNVEAYIELLRSNVRQQKAEIMGAVMQLDVVRRQNSGRSIVNTMRS